jgi:TPR repeat protein
MWDFLKLMLTAKPGIDLMVFGMLLIIIATVGAFQGKVTDAIEGKFDPGDKARIASGVIGTLALGIGIWLAVRPTAPPPPIAAKTASSSPDPDVDELAKKAQTLIDQKKWFEVVPLLEKLAAGGNTTAMVVLGHIYYDGKGVDQDLPEAFRWYQKAADAGNAEAMNEIGDAYENGNGVPKDLGKARDWYAKAILGGNTYAMLSLGVLSAKAGNWAEAKMWYERSATAGNIAAIINLGDIYKNGNGVETDYAKAKDLYLQAATAGSTVAMVRLAELYENGLGVPLDKEKAEEWKKKAKQ